MRYSKFKDKNYIFFNIDNELISRLRQALSTTHA